MSLITEALRKARQEAAQREGRERGIPHGLVVPPKRWRSGPGLALVVVIALAAALGGAGLAWWALGRRAATEASSAAPGRPVPATPAPAGAARPFPTSPAPFSPALKPPGEAPAGPEGQAERHDRAAAPAPVADTRGVEALVPPTPATVLEAAPNVSEPAPGQRSKPSEPVENARDRSFVIDANLGHVKLHLDYIVYRPGSPFAGINGQQVLIGSVIEGFQVEEIGPELVRLRDGRGTVVLRTH